MNSKPGEFNTWPEWFSGFWHGTREPEFAAIERKVAVGETISLFEWSVATGRTGRYIKALVESVTETDMALVGQVCRIVTFIPQRRGSLKVKNGLGKTVQPAFEEDFTNDAALKP